MTMIEWPYGYDGDAYDYYYYDYEICNECGGMGPDCICDELDKDE